MNLNRPLVRLSVAALIAIAAFGSGYAIGGVRGASWWMERLRLEVAGNLSYRVETLARLRTGDESGGVQLLEMSLDQAMLTLPQGENWEDFPLPVQQSMMLGKAYRAAYPASEDVPELSHILEQVPLPEAEYCSPALQRILGKDSIDGTDTQPSSAPSQGDSGGS